jgi:excisionase family DNA binding protein
MTAQKLSFVYRRNRPDLKNGDSASTDRLLNIDQVRRRLNCSKSHVYNLIQAGDLPAVTLGASKGKRVYESEVDEYISKKTNLDVTSQKMVVVQKNTGQRLAHLI